MLDLLTLAKARILFVEATGRTDLVVDTASYANKSTGLGANFFLQAGQRYLDQNTDTVQTLARVEMVLGEGEYELLFPSIRAVRKVGVLSEDALTYLEYRPEAWMRETYPDLTDLDGGTPLGWTRAVGSGASWDFLAEEEGGRILILPPPNEEISVFLEVRSYQSALVKDNDVSWWSLFHPDALIFAAAYKLEAFYRNRQGMSDWLEALVPILRQVNYDQDEEEAAGDYLEMGNSW